MHGERCQGKTLGNQITEKFIYSDKATKFWEISTLDLSYVVTVKSTVEILQYFVAFSEYMNFTKVVYISSSFRLLSHAIYFKLRLK